MSSKNVFLYKGKPYDFGRLGKNLDRVKKQLPPVLSEIAIQHFKDSFQNQGFTDRKLEKWKDRSPDAPRKNRAILIDSGDLRNSIHPDTVTFVKTIIASDKPYAQIHNEGGVISVPVTAKMKKFFWAMFYKTGKEKWKKMALSKKTEFKIKIEQRQFMGNSEVMESDLEAAINRKVMTIFD